MCWISRHLVIRPPVHLWNFQKSKPRFRPKQTQFRFLHSFEQIIAFLSKESNSSGHRAERAIVHSLNHSKHQARWAKWRLLQRATTWITNTHTLETTQKTWGEFSFGEKSSPGKFTGKRFSQVCMGKQLCWIKGVSEPGKYTGLKLLINTAPSHAANSAGLPIESDDVTFASSSTFVSRLSCGWCRSPNINEQDILLAT